MLITSVLAETLRYPGGMVNNSLLMPAAISIALVIKFFAVRYVSRASNLEGLWITIVINAFSFSTAFFTIPYIIVAWEFLYTHTVFNLQRWAILAPLNAPLNWVLSVGIIAFTYALIEFIVLWIFFRPLLLKNRTLLWLLLANLTASMGAIYVAIANP